MVLLYSQEGAFITMEEKSTKAKATTLPIWERKENPLEVCKTDFYAQESFCERKGKSSF